MSTSLRQILGRNVRRARNNLGISQMKLSEACGLSTSYIGDIERAEKFPSPEKIELLAGALGLRPYELFIDEKPLEVFDRQASLTSLSRDLKERLNGEIENLIRRYLK